VILRALLALCLACSLAACVGAAPQDASTTTDPKPLPQLRKADPLPPEHIDNRCKVDADCAKLQACAQVECRCVQDRCMQSAKGIDPEIDPAPAPPATI